MLKFIEMEFLKLKRSKIFLLTILGALASPAMMFVGILQYGSTHPSESMMAFKDFLLNINTYSLGLVSIILFCLVIGYLFTREYNEHTLKSILTVPVSRTKYLLGKFSMGLIWIIILAIISLVSSIIFASLGGLSGITLNIIYEMFYQYVGGAILLYLAMSPFIFISLLFKNLVPSIVGGAVVSVSNLFLFGHTWAPLSPWMSPCLIVSGDITKYSYGTTLPLIIIFLTFIIGIIISLIYFINKKDISL